MRNPLSLRLTRAALAIAASLVPTGLVGGAAPIPQGPVGPGRCGPVDPVFIQGATETGGQVFLLSPSEMAAPGRNLFTTSAADPVLLRAAGPPAGAAASLPLPVDGSIKRLVISSMFDNKGGTLEVLAPDGAAVEANDPTVDTRMNCGRVITVDRPAVGDWRANLSPTGQFWLLVHAVSDLDLVRAEFVGRASPDSEGFKIAGQPVLGRPATLRAQVAGPAMKSYQFVLLSAEGQPIKNVALAQVADSVWEGTFDLPSEPFRVAVTGVDGSGTRYQRSSRLPFHAEMVEVRPAALQASLHSGSEGRAAFTIRSAGPAARFRIVAFGGPVLVTRVEPAILDLDANAEQQIWIWLRAPADVPAGTETDLMVFASSDGPRPTSNSAVTRLSIRE
jgi:von Willebrand factor A domain-containing protein 7